MGLWAGNSIWRSLIALTSQLLYFYSVKVLLMLMLKLKLNIYVTYWIRWSIIYVWSISFHCFFFSFILLLHFNRNWNFYFIFSLDCFMLFQFCKHRKDVWFCENTRLTFVECCGNFHFFHFAILLSFSLSTTVNINLSHLLWIVNFSRKNMIVCLIMVWKILLVYLCLKRKPIVWIILFFE